MDETVKLRRRTRRGRRRKQRAEMKSEMYSVVGYVTKGGLRKKEKAKWGQRKGSG